MYNFSPSSAVKLETSYITPPTPMAVTVVNPVTYQFQVIEYMKDDKIVKVELQVQATTHDVTGNVIHSSGFTAVPRIQIPYIA